MTRGKLVSLLTTFAYLCFFSANSIASSIDMGERIVLRDNIQGQPILALPMVSKFYEDRGYQFAWSEKKNLKPVVDDLVKAIAQCEREGLKPEDYHLNMIQGILNLIETEKQHVPFSQFSDLDLLLTDAFLSYGSALLSGSVNPTSVDDEWFAKPRTGDLHEVLERAMAENNVRDLLEDLVPKQPIYQRMRNALARYRAIEQAGGWNIIPYGPSVKRGQDDARVPVVKVRLHQEGYLKSEPDDSMLLSGAVEKAIKQFQKDHGLEPDGVLGGATLTELNVTAEMRVRQLRVNMERCRWLPADLGDRYIFVNIPDFSLQVFDQKEMVMDMKVIVGRKMRRTPVFSSTMNQVVLNPSWTVTKNVATSDILDHVHEDSDYLQKHGFEVYANYDDDAPLIDPNTVNWSSMTSTNLPFKFRQKPGPLNALGTIKFLFPNRFDVYLHDTASRSLFNKWVRDFSSGCIRVQKPMDLAEFVLQGDPVWNRENLSKALKTGGNEQYISLKEPVQVHLMYWTAWVDERDRVQFREDLYGRDELLNRALHPG